VKTNLEKLKDSMRPEEMIGCDTTGKEYKNLITNRAAQVKYLNLAIADKIKQLNKDLVYIPCLFFSLPGLASKKNKEDKVAALTNLQSRITPDKTPGSKKQETKTLVNFNADVLDGETLALFKLAARIHSSKFIGTEFRALYKLNPEPRINRSTWFSV